MSLYSYKEVERFCKILNKSKDILTNKKLKKFKNNISKLKQEFIELRNLFLRKDKKLNMFLTGDSTATQDTLTITINDNSSTITSDSISDITTSNWVVDSDTINEWFSLTLVEDTKPETTENYYRIPPKGVDATAHSNHKVRTITIDKDKDIKAVYCTTCKKVIVYLLPRDEFSSMEEAQRWVDNH